MSSDASIATMPGGSKPRVLFFVPVPDFKGGAERSLLDLIANPGILPEVAVPAEGPLSAHFRDAGVPCHIVDFGAVASIRRPFRLGQGVAVLADALRAARQINAICREAGIALVHSNGMKAHMINALARRIGGRPAVVHIRDIANTRVETATWKLLQRASDRMIIVSRACWPEALLPANVRVVNNGISCPPEQVPATIAQPITLGFIGRIHPAKGLHLLLAWMAAAIRRGMQLRLLIRGSFAAETPSYEQEISQQVAALGLGDFVRFEGFVADPTQVYAGLQIVCVPSTTPDPFPRAVMEAMGLGMIVIGTPSGGIPDMIDDQETGFLVEEEAGFIAALDRLRTDPDFAVRIGLAARAKCIESFSLGRLHGSVSGLYGELFGSPFAPTPEIAAS